MLLAVVVGRLGTKLVVEAVLALGIVAETVVTGRVVTMELEVVPAGVVADCVVVVYATAVLELTLGEVGRMVVVVATTVVAVVVRNAVVVTVLVTVGEVAIVVVAAVVRNAVVVAVLVTVGEVAIVVVAAVVRNGVVVAVLVTVGEVAIVVIVEVGVLVLIEDAPE